MNEQSREIITLEGSRKVPLAVGATPQAIVPADIDQVWRLSGIIFDAKVAPRGLDTREKVCIAILHGLELRLPPMQAIRRIAVINNVPSVWGDAVPGIALATGLVEDWEEKIEGEGDGMVATCRVKRKNIATAAVRTFSVADAIKANLWDTRPKVKRRKRDGTLYDAVNDSPWFRYPKRMLQMRARVAFRDLFADALGGLYIAEELIGGKGSAPVERTDPGAADAGKSPQASAAPDPEVIEGEIIDGEVDEGEIVTDENADPEVDETVPAPPSPPEEAEVVRFAAADIEAFLKWAEEKLSKITPDDIKKDSEALNECWNKYVEPAMPADIFPPDRDEAIGLFRKHERRLAP